MHIRLIYYTTTNNNKCLSLLLDEQELIAQDDNFRITFFNKNFPRKIIYNKAKNAKQICKLPFDYTVEFS